MNLAEYIASVSNAASTILEGMAVTFSHLFREPITIQYPDKTDRPVVDMLPPRYRGGNMSTTGRSVLSGYWMVMGSRNRCENVTAMPSRMVLAAFETLAMYSAKFIRECSSVDVHS